MRHLVEALHALLVLHPLGLELCDQLLLSLSNCFLRMTYGSSRIDS